MLLSRRFVDDRAEKKKQADVDEAMRAADQIRQMMRLDGWMNHVVPFLDAYKNETLAQLCASPGRGEDLSSRAARDTYLRGCLEGQQILLGHLASILAEEQRALEDAGGESIVDASGEDLEDTPVHISGRFG